MSFPASPGACAQSVVEQLGDASTGLPASGVPMPSGREDLGALCMLKLGWTSESSVFPGNRYGGKAIQTEGSFWPSL